MDGQRRRHGHRRRCHARAATSSSWRSQARDGDATAALRGNDAVVNLDTDVTDELRAEGTARDLVRQVQQARKEEGLVVTDRIVLTMQAGDRIVAALDPTSTG